MPDIRQRLLPAATLGCLAALAVALWVMVFIRAPSATTESSPSAARGASASADPSGSASPVGPSESAAPAPSSEGIELSSTSYSGRPFETVRIRGALSEARPGTALRLQVRQGSRWRTFPLPTTTNAAGRFTAYVEMGAPGTYELRVRDPRTAQVSPVVTLDVN